MRRLPLALLLLLPAGTPVVPAGAALIHHPIATVTRAILPTEGTHATRPASPQVQRQATDSPVRRATAPTRARAAQGRRAGMAQPWKLRPVAPRPRPFDLFADAPHTHAGLLAWSHTLAWPWPGIIRCESLADDSWTVHSSSHARGILQFLPSTWRSLGLTGDPAAATWRQQLAAAVRLRARDGLGAWDCARILHYS